MDVTVNIIALSAGVLVGAIIGNVVGDLINKWIARTWFDD